MGLIDSYRRTLELTEIEERLRVLENANAKLQSTTCIGEIFT